MRDWSLISVNSPYIILILVAHGPPGLICGNIRVSYPVTQKVRPCASRSNLDLGPPYGYSLKYKSIVTLTSSLRGGEIKMQTPTCSPVPELFESWQ